MTGQCRRALKDLESESVRSCYRTYVALSTTCRQLSTETKTSFYGKNIFCAWIPYEREDLVRVLGCLDPILRHLKHVVFYRSCASGQETRGKLAVLDFLIKDTEVLSNLLMANDHARGVIARAVIAISHANGTLHVADDDLQRAARERLGDTMQSFSEGVRQRGCFTRPLLTTLEEDLVKIW